MPEYYKTTYSSRYLESNASQIEHEETIRQMTEFINENPQSSNAFHNRAIAFYNLGQIETALEDFERAISCDAQNFEPHRLKAAIFKKSGDFLKAVESYTQAIESAKLKGDSYSLWEILRARAAVYVELNQPHKAVEDLSAAIKQSPTLKNAFLERGKILYEIGEREKAIEDLKSASIFGADLDWFSVFDIVRAERELQTSGFLLTFWQVSELVRLAGMPVSGKHLSREEQLAAMRENRLMKIGTFRSMGDAEILFYPATEEEMHQPATDFLLFPKAVPPHLFETHWTDYEYADQLFALFRKFEKH